MADLVSYYVETTPIHGPAAIYRRRPDDERGARVDEHLVPEDGTWRRHDGVRRYEAGRADWDFYGVHPDEGERVVAWLRRAAEVGRDEAGPPPVLGEWSVGYAWVLRLKGPLPEQAVTTVLDRLGMARRADTASWREHDLGLRVLRGDAECRWNFELYRASAQRWSLRLLYLRLTPDEHVIQGLRDQVYPLVEELGLEVVEEQVAGEASYPLSDRARAQTRPWADWLLAAWFRGRLTERGLRTLHERLGLEAESGADLDDPVDEWGTGRLPNDGRFRAELRLRRTFGDEDRWRFEIGVDGVRPPEETVDRWHAEITAAATDVGLVHERDWLAPRPAPPHRTAPARRATRTSGQVSVLYRAYLDGRFTAESLDGFRAALGIRGRGRIDDDTEQVFGERVLRAEENRVVRLMLARTFDGDWYLSLSSQDTPPDRAALDEVVRDVHAAAAGAGLTVSREWHNPPGGENS